MKTLRRFLVILLAALACFAQGLEHIKAQARQQREHHPIAVEHVAAHHGAMGNFAQRRQPVEHEVEVRDWAAGGRAAQAEWDESSPTLEGRAVLAGTVML